MTATRPRAAPTDLEREAEQPELTECADNDSPWLVCKPCAAAGRCKQAEQPSELMRHVRRLQRNVEEWCAWYGAIDVLARNPLPLPPAGTVRLLEDLDEAIKATHQGALQVAASWAGDPSMQDYASTQAEQAQPAREPFITNDMVASALDAISKRHEIRPTVHTMAEALHAALLAAPPAAQPLTDADIEAVMGPCEGSAFAEHLRREFVKSFKRVYFKLHPERAHGIGQPPEARFGYMDGDEA